MTEQLITGTRVRIAARLDRGHWDDDARLARRAGAGQEAVVVSIMDPRRGLYCVELDGGPVVIYEAHELTPVRHKGETDGADSDSRAPVLEGRLAAAEERLARLAELVRGLIPGSPVEQAAEPDGEEPGPMPDDELTEALKAGREWCAWPARTEATCSMVRNAVDMESALSVRAMLAALGALPTILHAWSEMEDDLAAFYGRLSLPELVRRARAELLDEEQAGRQMDRVKGRLCRLANVDESETLSEALNVIEERLRLMRRLHAAASEQMGSPYIACAALEDALAALLDAGYHPPGEQCSNCGQSGQHKEACPEPREQQLREAFDVMHASGGPVFDAVAAQPNEAPASGLADVLRMAQAREEQLYTILCRAAGIDPAKELLIGELQRRFEASLGATRAEHNRLASRADELERREEQARRRNAEALETLRAAFKLRPGCSKVNEAAEDAVADAAAAIDANRALLVDLRDILAGDDAAHTLPEPGALREAAARAMLHAQPVLHWLEGGYTAEELRRTADGIRAIAGEAPVAELLEQLADLKGGC